jgi:tRNA pseudouridine38-40 synthase
MQRGMSFFRGEKDFSRFANAKQPNTVRTVFKLEMKTRPSIDYLASSDNNSSDGGRILQFIISANGFLYHMVRNIIGTLIDLGRGRISLSYIENIFFGANGNYPHTIAAPSGLCLSEVGY